MDNIQVDYHMKRLYNLYLVPDIDECELRTDGCSQDCHNLMPRYSCDCDRGFNLSADGVTCEGTEKRYIAIMLEVRILN